MSNKLIISEILKYLDCFGATFNFYIERNRKLYTPLGGIFAILSFIFSLLIFIYIYSDDFLHNLPNSTTSTEKEKHRQITFREEKIWIPWRIRDFGGKTINHTNLLYPIIYYYKGIKDNNLKSMVVSHEFISYKLCNETSMVNNSNLYIIDLELDQLYCIDMEDLNIGGSWDSDFLYLITLDIYGCKNGIDYDENNRDCTTYDKIIEIVGDNNCLEFEMYYPVVHYQPMNKSNPIFIEYTNYFYHLSRFSNKIDRLYLQQHILKDDRGWALKNEEIYSRWGSASLNGDSYATGNKRDLMNEGSTSRFYSFNIYLKSHIIYYNRSYKKLYLIAAEGLPIINIVFIIFGLIAKIFKISSGNKKLTELLFENLKEKRNFMKVYQKKMKTDRNLNAAKNNFQLSNHNISLNRNNDFSSAQLTYNNLGKKSLILKNNHIINENIKEDNKKEQHSDLGNNYKTNPINKYYSVKIINRSFNSNLGLEENKNLNDNFLNFNTDYLNNKSIDKSSNLPFNNLNMKTDYQSQKSVADIIEDKLKLKTHYVKKKLFPYKYYLCSIFIKNINISKKSYFFTKKFIVVYNFICQLFDISSYLILQREFQTMKNTVIEENQRNIIEKGQKINVNATSFNLNMRECLDSKKLSIFGRFKQTK